MTGEERKLWIRLAQGIEEKIVANKPLSGTQLKSYWRLRRVDPLIQMKWDAATASDGAGLLLFPNGNQLFYETIRVTERTERNT
jgi:hypothetical protein